MAERHTRQGHDEPTRGSKRRHLGRSEHMPVIAAGGCWCGDPVVGHDWEGKADGAPHPRGDAS